MTVLTERQIRKLNNWLDSEPILKKIINSPITSKGFGNIIEDALDNPQLIEIISGETLPTAAEFAVISTKSDPEKGDFAVAYITSPNTGGTVTQSLDAAVVDALKVQVSPNVVPTNADGVLTVIVFRPNPHNPQDSFTRLNLGNIPNLVSLIDADNEEYFIKDVNDKISRARDLSSPELNFIQNTSLLQPTWVKDAVNGRPAMFFPASTMAILEAEGPRSAYRFLHDGTGMTVWMVLLVPSGGLISNIIASTLNSGLTGFRVSTILLGANQFQFRMENGTAQGSETISTATGSLPLDELFILRLKFAKNPSVSGDDMEIYVNSVKEGGIAYPETPDSGDSNIDLFFGTSSNDGVTFAKVIISSEYHDEHFCQQVDQSLKNDYKIFPYQ